MLGKRKYMALMVSIILMVSNVGVPIYKVYCNCTGNTTVSVLIEPAKCAPHVIHVEDDCCHHDAECATTAHDEKVPCDNEEVEIVQFLPIADNSTKTIQLVASEITLSMFAQKLSNFDISTPEKTVFTELIEIAPPPKRAGVELLHFICVSKTPSANGFIA